ncbi:hypothetical protein [Nonomuraea sp. SYSU D8015]|uniref:hypothetical protein n=1 Tax=Nonomuraea sp. SYSU D8015 TaxID=2593644 RepID=UPI0016609283|nr:hypothetical protein [Nonomuraea sp. SYSU D8015]
MHYHVIRHGENGGGKLGGRIFEDFAVGLKEFHALAPVHKRYLTERHCRDIFAQGKVVRLRHGDENGRKPIAYFADCHCTDGSCV